MGEHESGGDYPEAQLNGGWGYFLVERSEATLPGSLENRQECVELYLYREGE
jgi:hypothetical protein